VTQTAASFDLANATPQEAAAFLERLRKASIIRKGLARHRYQRRYHRHAPATKRVKVRSEADKTRALIQEGMRLKRFTRLGVLFIGALEWMRGSPDVKRLATPRGQYHSATKKGPGRRPLHPRSEVGISTAGTKWLPRGFPRGY
jgi:hypothetical protein